ncbi:MAG: hypothetical protein PHQ81_11790 [Methanofollis sp.]|nr:hypothetical protein [Methanofollis sp.]
MWRGIRGAAKPPDREIHQEDFYRAEIEKEHIPKLSRVEGLLELKCFLPEILNALLHRGSAVLNPLMWAGVRECNPRHV